MVSLEDPTSPSRPAVVPWWKRPGVWLVAVVGAVVAFVLAALRPPAKPLVILPPPPPPPPPAPPDVPVVRIPQVNTKPADTYDLTRLLPPDRAPTDAEVDAAIARLNAADGKDAK